MKKIGCDSYRSNSGSATLLLWHYQGCAKVAAGKAHRRLESLQVRSSKVRRSFHPKKLDVTIKSECDIFADAVMKKWGTIDILVNNAGLQPLSFFKNLQVEEWDKMIDVNIRGVLYCTAAVITPMLNKKSGHIVNISSMLEDFYPQGLSTCDQASPLQRSGEVLDRFQPEVDIRLLH